MNEELLAAIERELLAWPGVEQGPGMFGSVRYTLGRREIGHVHGDGVADLPFPRRVHDELIAAGRAGPHRAGSPGFVSVRIRSADDVPAVIALFRMNVERTREIIARRQRVAPREGKG